MKGLTIIKQKFHKITFKSRVTIALITFSLLLTVYLGISSYRVSSDVILDMSRKLSDSNFNIVYRALDAYFDNTEKYTTLFIRMPVLREILQADSESDITQRENTELGRAVREIINMASSNDNLSYNVLSIYCKNGFSYNYFDQIDFPYTDYQSCIDHYTESNYISEGYKPPTWCDIIATRDPLGRPDSSFINYRVLYAPVTMEEVGILLTGIRESDLSGIYSDISDKAFIMQKNGLIISHSDKSLIGVRLEDEAWKAIYGSDKTKDSIDITIQDEMQLVTFNLIANNDAYFIVPFDYYSGAEVLEAQDFRVSIIFIAIIGIVISIAISMVISKGLSSSILGLKKTMQAVHDGNLDARYTSGSNDEIMYLGERFNDMLDQINRFFREQKEYESAKSVLEIKLLQSQINPHLLYNTLDSVLWSLDKRDIDHGKEIIYSLSNFFKLSLSSGNDLITIQKELDLIRNYITIQKTARGKDYALKVNIPEKLLGIRIPKLLIQPLVENAILHAFSGFRDDDSGVITISAELSKDRKTVITMVEDNGIGIAEQKLADINNSINTFPPKGEIESFGLYNIQRRLITQFGDEYRLCIESELGNYTRVFINTPTDANIPKEKLSNV